MRIARSAICDHRSRSSESSSEKLYQSLFKNRDAKHGSVERSRFRTSYCLLLHFFFLFLEKALTYINRSLLVNIYFYINIIYAYLHNSCQNYIRELSDVVIIVNETCVGFSAFATRWLGGSG